MKFIIKKGRHGAFPYMFLPFIGAPILQRTVTFTPSCIYNLDGSPDTNTGDDHDINKLFGFGFFTLRKIPMHHWESFRIGWTYNGETKLIDLYAYQYRKGKRITSYIDSVAIGKPVSFYLTASSSHYKIVISLGEYQSARTRQLLLTRGGHSSLGYYLGPYFGGNQAAPRQISLLIY